MKLKVMFPKITYMIKIVKRSIWMKMFREENSFAILSSHSWYNLLSLIQEWSLIPNLMKSFQFCDSMEVAK